MGKDAVGLSYVGLGLCYEDLTIGRRFRTIGRTVTEADIANFINRTGTAEVLFMDLDFPRSRERRQGPRRTRHVWSHLRPRTVDASHRAAH